MLLTGKKTEHNHRDWKRVIENLISRAMPHRIWPEAPKLMTYSFERQHPLLLKKFLSYQYLVLDLKICNTLPGND